MSKQHKTVPKFASEADERAFREAHDSADYLDWTKAQRVVLPNLKPTTDLSPSASASAGFDQGRG